MRRRTEDDRRQPHRSSVVLRPSSHPNNAMNLFTAAMRQNPYPFYRWLREAHPIYFDAEHGFWLVSRYADVLAAFRDPRLLSGRGDSLEKLKEAGDEDLSMVYNAVADMVLFADPPKHTRLRNLMQKAFTPKSLEVMHASVQRITDELIDAVRPTGQIDLVNDFAMKLPMFVISELLGVKREHREQFQQWTEAFNTFTGKVNTSAEENDRTVRGMKAMFAYFRERIVELRARPTQGLLSDLVQAEMQGDRLTPDELLANCVLLLSAGFDTTANLIGNGGLALMQNPAQMQRLLADPGLMTGAVEELTRYDSSVQFTGRMVKQDFEWHGQNLHAGDFVMLLTGSANRDELQFAEPDVLDVARKDNKHIGFGYGIHFCLGAPLARIEAKIAFGTLLKRLPNLNLTTDQLEWRDNFSVRGVLSLPLAFDISSD